jgi:hypothetical protein
MTATEDPKRTAENKLKELPSRAKLRMVRELPRKSISRIDKALGTLTTP